MRAPENEAVGAWLKTVTRDQRWCAVINADPDAMGAAFALKRIMSSRTRLDVFRVNEITRPDNLALIRQLHLELAPWDPELREIYTHYAIVDGQPHHHVSFAGIPFSVVVDHHPMPREEKWKAAPGGFVDIRPGLGSTCTMFAGYLQHLGVRPSPTLATAMLIGIRSDTSLFERSGGEEDFLAYQWLSGRADSAIVRRIVRSEYLRPWLPLFSRAFRNLKDCRGTGCHAWIGDVNTADLLVAIADFFTRVHGLRWVAVSGVVQKKTVVVIFRSDGSRDIGRLADACFYDVGSAGGHRALARAEFPLSAVPADESCQDFIQRRLQRRKLRSRKA